MQTAASYSTVINTLCNSGTGDACTTAQTNLALDSACTTALAEGNADVICMGDCRTLLDAVVDNCDAAVSQQYKITCKNFAIVLQM